MPNTKSFDIRIRVLDRCLRRGGYSMVSLKDAVNKELEFHGYPLVTALNTIRNDLRFIESSYPDIGIIETRSGRYRTYGYRDAGMSIYKLQFSDEELGLLSQCLAVLSHFEGLPQAEWLEAFIERFKMSLNIESDLTYVVGFDENKFLKGRHHFIKLLRAITEGKVTDIEYTSFKESKSHLFTVHPYYLKEYNNRWFLLSKVVSRKDISIFALDRMDRVEINTSVKYEPNLSIDFNEDYFADIVGVSRRSLDKPCKVSLHVSPKLTPYVSTKPIHESQRMKMLAGGAAIIELDIIINYELEQLLLSYCDDIKVVSPDSLADRIKFRLSTALENYSDRQA